MVIGMALISIVFGLQGYLTFQSNTEQLVESIALRNQVIATSLIQNLDLFIDSRVSDFQSLEKAKEIRQILQSSNEEFSYIEDLDAYMEGKSKSYENFDRTLPFVTQVIDRQHQLELFSIIKNYDQTYGFDFAEEFYVTNAFGADVVLIFGSSDYSHYDEPWWQITKSQGVYLGDVEYFPNYNSYSVPLGISISDENDEFIGAVRVLIGVDHLLSDFTNNLSLLEEQNKEVILLDNEGRIIYSDGIKIDDNLTVPFFNQIKEQEGNFKLLLDGSSQVISYARSEEVDSSELGWTVVVKQSESDIISSLEDVRNSLVLPSIFGIIVTAVIGVIITIFVSRPLEKLTRKFHQLSSGKFDEEAEASSIHEINIISNSYNDFSKSLKKLIQTEKDLSEAQVKAKNERLLAIGELSASMAHDMKNPLAVLKTATDVLKRKFKGQDEKIDKLFLNMDDGINRISHQIKDVLEYVRITPANLKKTSLKKMVNLAISSIEIPSNISVSIPQNDIEIECDAEKMEIVLINLILNAVQEIGNKVGKIEISTKDEIDDYIIEIANSGSPIPEELLKKIFEPLFTTKLRGTGLGLATCKNVIEQHGGSIAAKNDPTRFVIKFPKNSTENSAEKDK